MLPTRVGVAPFRINHEIEEVPKMYVKHQVFSELYHTMSFAGTTCLSSAMLARTMRSGHAQHARVTTNHSMTTMMYARYASHQLKTRSRLARRYVCMYICVYVEHTFAHY